MESNTRLLHALNISQMGMFYIGIQYVVIVFSPPIFGFTFPNNQTIMYGIAGVLLLFYLMASKQLEAVGFRKLTDWRSLLFFTPLFIEVIYELTRHSINAPVMTSTTAAVIRSVQHDAGYDSVSRELGDGVATRTSERSLR